MSTSVLAKTRHGATGPSTLAVHFTGELEELSSSPLIFLKAAVPDTLTLVSLISCCLPQFRAEMIRLVSEQGMTINARTGGGELLTFGPSDPWPQEISAIWVTADYVLQGTIGSLILGVGGVVGSAFTGGLLSVALLGIGSTLLKNGVNRVFNKQPSRTTRVEEERRQNQVYNAITGASGRDNPVPVLMGHYKIKNPPILSSSRLAVRDHNGDGIVSVDPLETARVAAGHVGGYRSTLSG